MRIPGGQVVPEGLDDFATGIELHLGIYDFAEAEPMFMGTEGVEIIAGLAIIVIGDTVHGRFHPPCNTHHTRKKGYL
jgi:hypothetical protein